MRDISLDLDWVELYWKQEKGSLHTTQMVSDRYNNEKKQTAKKRTERLRAGLEKPPVVSRIAFRPVSFFIIGYPVRCQTLVGKREKK